MTSPESVPAPSCEPSPDLESNRAVADLLDRLAALHAVKGDNPFRARAYQEAALHVRGTNRSVVELWRAGQLETIPGVGRSIAEKIDEYLRTGHSTYLDELQKSLPAGVDRLLAIPGIGPARARLLAERLGISTPEELAAAARAHRLRDLPGFGVRLEERIAVEAQRWAQRERRLLLGVAWPAADSLVQHLATNPLFVHVSVAGSLRRMRETIGDIDLIAASARPAEATRAFTRLPPVREVLAIGPTKASVLLEDGLQVDLRVVEPESWGAALQYFTGSKLHNIALRDRAISKGLRLNEYGVFEERTGRRLAGEDESGVYHSLGLDWIPPELREDRGEIAAAAEHLLPVLIERSDLQGDLHVHTSWSDGTASVEAMAAAARAAHLSYVAITDHTPGLTIAHGLTVERFRQQRRAIDAVNRRLAPFRVLQGAEVDVRADGSLDLPDELLAQLDYVAISVHRAFTLERAAMTERIVRAIRHPRVVTLNHPTGRLIGRRPGYNVDLEVVLRAAAAAGVAVEINSQPDRLDLDDVWARRAKDLGCRLTIDSDTHAPEGFANLRYGVAVARRGWLTSADVLTTLPLAELEAWLRRKQRRAA